MRGESAFFDDDGACAFHVFDHVDFGLAGDEDVAVFEPVFEFVDGGADDGFAADAFLAEAEAAG